MSRRPARLRGAMVALIGVALTGATLGAAGVSPAAPPSAQAAPALPDPAQAELEQKLASRAAAESYSRGAVRELLAEREVRLAAEEAARVAAEEQRRAEEQAAAEAAAEAARVAEAAARQAALDAAVADPRGVARVLAGDRGWGGEQFRCLDRLWTRESGWKHTADNPSSSAYGIPQALPGRKMASAGPDWQTNPVTQISWGLGYIRDTYGTPCGAWAKSEAVGWY